ncbi:MAG: sodium:solute symporter family transporter, partial [Limisphaerales bacterium]
SDHPQRPWTGMVSGLLVLHLYYWGANQFIVQRALSARSLKEARTGIILAGFVKLLIPFLSIGTGVAAYYLFQQEQPGIKLDGDTAFPMLLREVVAPLGIAGLVGLVAAGLVGAILSSVDSMMNSAATLITFDFYKKFINPNATDGQLVRLGRIIIGVLVLLAAGLTILVFDPNTQEPFFSHVVKHQSKLVAGLVAAFLLGMAWKGATAAGGLASIVVGVVVSYGFPPLYAAWLADVPAIKSLFGSQLNFFHSVFIAFIAAVIANVIVSKYSGVDEEKSKYTWVGLKLFREMDLIHFAKKLIGTIVVFVLLGFFMTGQLISPLAAGLIGAIWTWVMFMDSLFQLVLSAAAKGRGYSLLREDRFWAGLLAACAVFMLFYFA